jgi:hypothetical protein
VNGTSERERVCRESQMVKLVVVSLVEREVNRQHGRRCLVPHGRRGGHKRPRCDGDGDF